MAGRERLAESTGEAIRVLKLDELKREALVLVAHGAAPHAAEDDNAADRGFHGASGRGTAQPGGGVANDGNFTAKLGGLG